MNATTAATETAATETTGNAENAATAETHATADATISRPSPTSGVAVEAPSNAAGPVHFEPRHWTTPDGTRLWYEVAGEADPAGLDIVLCDGIGCDGFVWKYMVSVLRPLGRVIHLHMRGHGHSATPTDLDAVGIDQLAEDWIGLLEHLGSRRTVVLGHSLGVQVALELHRRDTERTQALVLLCGSFENPVATFRDSPVLGKLLPLIEKATRLGGPALRVLWHRAIKLPAAYYVATRTELHPDLTRRGDVEAYLDHLARMNPPFFFRMLSKAGLHTARAHLPTVREPVLVVAGARDQFTPARLSAEMAELLPHATLLHIETGAHAAPVEHPVLVNLAVQRFLDEALAPLLSPATPEAPEA